MNTLILGSGGREHALAWKLAQSPLISALYTAPGNPGTALVGNNLSLDISDFKQVEKQIRKYNIDLLVVGPEQVLVEGIRDYLENLPGLENLLIIGPEEKAAALEGSKEFAKEFMQRHNIPTAAYRSFNRKNLQSALSYLEEINPPYVLKADGLAAGKGVIITHDLSHAKEVTHEILKGNKFGKAGHTLVIEEFLEGIEMSIFILTDGKDYLLLPEAKDYKRIGEGDTGLNTGGMGAVSPVPFADETLLHKIENKIIRPTVNGLFKEKIPYMGFLFIGLMIRHGEPYVIEYNVRMGDPETEVVIPRIKSDLAELFLAVKHHRLKETIIEIDPRHAVTVMAVSGGYPEAYEKEKIISLPSLTQGILFHAGTSLKEDKLVTGGGRVLCITSYGNSIQDALNKSYQSLKEIHFEGMYYRRDIGLDLLNYQNNG